MWTLLIHKQGQVLWFLILLLNNNVWSGHFLKIQTILWDSEECPAHSAQFCKQSLEQLAHLVAVVVDIQEAITWSCPKAIAIIIIVIKSNIEKRVVKADSWSALFFPVKCGIANFFLVNHDSLSSHEAWFCKIIFHETRNKCLICSEPWFSLCLLFSTTVLRNKWYCTTVTGRFILVVTTWWSGFRWPLASHHFCPLFCLFRPKWQKHIHAMSEMTW